MSDDLSAARKEHQQLRDILHQQYTQADPAPVEAWALRAVFRLLCAHTPSIDDARSSGDVCLTCWEAWPCAVYQAIEMESHHGE